MDGFSAVPIAFTYLDINDRQIQPELLRLHMILCQFFHSYGGLGLAHTISGNSISCIFARRSRHCCRFSSSCHCRLTATVESTNWETKDLNRTYLWLCSGLCARLCYLPFRHDLERTDISKSRLKIEQWKKYIPIW